MVNNGRGVHWSASVYHLEYTNGNEWARWKRELAALNTKYVKVLDDGGDSSYGLAVALRKECDIIPIVRLYRHQPNAVGAQGQIQDREAQTARRIVQGVGEPVAFETNNEPDVRDEWRNGVMPARWWEVVIDNLYWDAVKILDVGGIWLFPAFTHGATLQVPGAQPHYHNILRTFADRHANKNPTGEAVLKNPRTGIAIHNYMKHPMDYPYDEVNQHGKQLTREEYERLGWGPSGPTWAWDDQPMELINQWRIEDKNTGDTVFDDWTCFNQYQVLDAWAVEVTGDHMPIYTTEGGSVIGDRVDRRYPRVSPEQQKAETLAIAQWMMDEAPAWYVAHCDWLIADAEMGHADGDHYTAWETQCWYTWRWSTTSGWNFKGQIPLVQAMKEMPSYERKNGGALPPPPTEPPVEPPVVIPPPEPDLDWQIPDELPKVEYVPAAVEAREVYWKLTKARWENELQAQGRHSIYIEVLNRDGKRIVGVPVAMRNGGVSVGKTEDKPYPEFAVNFPMTGTLGSYTVGVEQGITDKVKGLGLGSIEQPAYSIHTCFYLTFQEAVKEGELPEPGPDLSGWHALLLGQTAEAIEWESVLALENYIESYRSTITLSHDDAMRYPNASIISTAAMPVSQEIIDLVAAKVHWHEVIVVDDWMELKAIMDERANSGDKYGLKP